MINIKNNINVIYLLIIIFKTYLKDKIINDNVCIGIYKENVEYISI